MVLCDVEVLCLCVFGITLFLYPISGTISFSDKTVTIGNHFSHLFTHVRMVNGVLLNYLYMLRLHATDV